MLRNPLVVQTIIERAQIKSTDTIIEIGPGTGNLTIKMLELASRVICYEIDRRMVSELQKRVSSEAPHLYHKLTVVHGDFLKAELPPYDMCISNCPYNISSAIVFKLLSTPPVAGKPRRHVLMFQREFAMSLTAKPGDGDYARISASAQLLAKTEHIMKVSRNSFRPPPKVDSSVVLLEPFGKGEFPEGFDIKEYEGLVRMCFNRKNRQLSAIFSQSRALTQIIEAKNALAACKGEPTINESEAKAEILKILEEGGYSTMRASKMSVSDFVKLLRDLNSAGYRFSE